MIERDEICTALCHVLGNTCRIYRTTRCYEWNASGKGADLARMCFHDQANELATTALPEIASHIRALDGSPILDYSDGVVKIDPPTAQDIPTLSEMITNLRSGHEQANISISAAIDIAREIDEWPTLSFLTTQVTLHRLHRKRLGLLQDD